MSAAVANRVEKVVVLSTDKAVYPINAMGQTKALMEKVMVAKSRSLSSTETLLCATRYGNVMVSRGSVIPLFVSQIKAGKLKPLAVVAEQRLRFEPVLEVQGRGRAAFALVANGDPYTYAGSVPIRVAPEARFELGLDLVAPKRVGALTLPRLLRYVLTGRGQARSRELLYGHDLDRIEIACDRPLPLQADGEDLGDVEEAVFEAERDAVAVLI